MSSPPLARVQNKAEWQQRRAVVREKTLEALGLQPMPDRLPLETRSGGVIEREGHRAERLYWQTWPGAFMGGWLYTPRPPGEGAPTVLILSGIAAVRSEIGEDPSRLHSELAWWASLGYIALATDPQSHWDHKLGVFGSTLEAVSNLRALDLLAGRPEVDRQRMGLLSYPGTTEPAMHLLALDDRIRAAVLADPTLSLARRMRGEKMTIPAIESPGFLRFTDGPELCAVASPRALLFLTPEGAASEAFREQELRELRAYYQLWLQPDRLAHVATGSGTLTEPAGRQAAHDWLDRELRGSRNPQPVTVPEPSLGDPDEYGKLTPKEPPYPVTEPIQRWYEKRVAAQPPQLEGKPARKNYQERVSAELRYLLALPEADCALQSRRAPVTESPLAGRVPDSYQRVEFQSELDVRVPALWRAGQIRPPWPVLIALHPRGKEEAIRTELVREFEAAGYAILAPDVRLRGELAVHWLEETVLWGRPEAGMAVTDVHACLRWLLGEEEVDAREIVLWGDGDQGVTALLAAGLDERISATIADCLSTTYRDGSQELPLVTNILRVADLPQIASLVAPRPLWLYRVPEERVGFSSRRYYDWTRRSFQSLGEVEALKMSTKDLPEPEALREWLKVRLKRAKR